MTLETKNLYAATLDVSKKYGTNFIYLKEESFDDSIGTITIMADDEIRCYLKAEYQSIGYGSEILKAAKEYVISNGGKPFLKIDKEHENSIRAAIKCGFKETGRILSSVYYYPEASEIERKENGKTN